MFLCSSLQNCICENTHFTDEDMFWKEKFNIRWLHHFGLCTKSQRVTAYWFTTNCTNHILVSFLADADVSVSGVYEISEDHLDSITSNRLLFHISLSDHFTFSPIKKKRKRRDKVHDIYCMLQICWAVMLIQVIQVRVWPATVLIPLPFSLPKYFSSCQSLLSIFNKASPLPPQIKKKN